MIHCAMARQKPAIIFIFITLFLDVFGIGLIVPVLPKLVQQMQGGDLHSAAHAVGWLGALYALMQFVFSPVLGSLSDRFGRRPVILCSLFGSGIDYLLAGLGAHHRLALSGAHRFRGDGGEFLRGQRLHCGRDAAGKTCGGFRHDWRGIRAWVHRRAGHRRVAWRVWPAHAIPGSGRGHPAELALRGVCPA